MTSSQISIAIAKAWLHAIESGRCFELPLHYDGLLFFFDRTRIVVITKITMVEKRSECVKEQYIND